MLLNMKRGWRLVKQGGIKSFSYSKNLHDRLYSGLLKGSSVLLFRDIHVYIISFSRAELDGVLLQDCRHE